MKIEQANKLINEHQSYLEDVMFTDYTDESIQVEFPTVHNDVEDLKTKTKELSSSLEQKTNKLDFKSSIYWQNISYVNKTDSDSKTDYQITTIDIIDKNGEKLKLIRGFADDNVNSGNIETARTFSSRHKASFVINASTYNTSDNKLIGTQIYNGQIINEDVSIWNKMIIAWDDNLNFKSFKSSEGANKILSEGYTNALVGFIPLIENGDEVSQTIKQLYVPWSERHPRQILAKTTDNKILILSTDGRKNDNPGFTCDDCIRVLKSHGSIEYAYMLDGGGSTQTVVKGSLINARIDNGGYTERKVPDFLYFSKEPNTLKDCDIAYLNYITGSLNRKINDLALDIVNNVLFTKGYIQLKGSDTYDFQGIESWTGDSKNTKLSLNKEYLQYWDYNNAKLVFKVDLDGEMRTGKGILANNLHVLPQIDDFNTIIYTGVYYSLLTTNNRPSDVSYITHHYHISDNNKMQIAYPFKNDVSYKPKTRRMVNGVWESWRDL